MKIEGEITHGLEEVGSVNRGTPVDIPNASQLYLVTDVGSKTYGCITLVSLRDGTGWVVKPDTLVRPVNAKVVIEPNP